MDIFDIRTRNLLFVLEQVLAPRGIRRTKDAAQALGGLGSSYLSQLKGGKRIGDETARKIEQSIQWDHGDFDTPQWLAWGVREPSARYHATETSPMLTPREKALLENYRAASDATKDIVDATAAAAAKPGKMNAKRSA